MNIDKLKEAIKESGLKKAYLAQQLGLSAPTFRSKVNGLSAMTYDEVAKLKYLLKLSDKEFHEIF